MTDQLDVTPIVDALTNAEAAIVRAYAGIGADGMPDPIKTQTALLYVAGRRLGHTITLDDCADATQDETRRVLARFPLDPPRDRSQAIADLVAGLGLPASTPGE